MSNTAFVKDQMYPVCLNGKKENLNKPEENPHENISAELIHINDAELNKRS